jgi:hypothetical protein
MTRGEKIWLSEQFSNLEEHSFKGWSGADGRIKRQTTSTEAKA